jgi:hypothetical protein
MSSQGPSSTQNETWQEGVVSTRDSSDWTSLKKRRTLYRQLRGNTGIVEFKQLKSFDLMMDYNFGSVLCGGTGTTGCIGGAGFPLLTTGS